MFNEKYYICKVQKQKKNFIQEKTLAPALYSVK